MIGCLRGSRQHPRAEEIHQGANLGCWLLTDRPEHMEHPGVYLPISQHRAQPAIGEGLRYGEIRQVGYTQAA